MSRVQSLYKLSDTDPIKIWLQTKKIKESDLIFCQSLKSDSDWQIFLKALQLIIDLKVSFTDSMKTLEILTELILMNLENKIFENSESFETWSDQLKKLRYPKTSQRDETLKIKFQSLSWPFGSKTKFERRGDRAGVELKIFITSETDLIKTIASLERVKEQLKELSKEDNSTTQNISL